MGTHTLKGVRPLYTPPMRVLLLAGYSALVACGQTGPLYLPDEGVQTPVEIRGPTTAAPATPATPPADTPPPESEEKDRKNDPPQGR